MEKIRILLAEDHVSVREGFKAALESDSKFIVTGEADTGKHAVDLAEELKPDVIVMDVSMPEMDGIEASGIIKSKYPDMKILILTMYDNKHYIYEALSIGIEEYIYKMATMQDLRKAIDAIASGDEFFDSNITEMLHPKMLARKLHKRHNYVDPETGITEREMEIIDLIINGYTTSEIAGHLRLSKFTVSNHRRNILKKLNLKNTAELVRYTLKEGLDRDTD